MPALATRHRRHRPGPAAAPSCRQADQTVPPGPQRIRAVELLGDRLPRLFDRDRLALGPPRSEALDLFRGELALQVDDDRAVLDGVRQAMDRGQALGGVGLELLDPHLLALADDAQVGATAAVAAVQQSAKVFGVVSLAAEDGVDLIHEQGRVPLVHRTEDGGQGGTAGRKRLAHHDLEAVLQERLSTALLRRLDREVGRHIELVVQPAVAHPQGACVGLLRAGEHDVATQESGRAVESGQ